MYDFLSDIPSHRPPRKAKPPKPKIPQWCKDRYEAAHKQRFNKVAEAAGHYFEADMPDCNTANGLTLAINNFLIWEGWNSKGIDSGGRKINGKWRQGRTRRGASDISSTIRGMAVMWEVKIGSDRPSEYQLKEQAKEIAAGGKYYFVKTWEEFLTIYDGLT